MASQLGSDYSAFHGRELANDEPRAVGLRESLWSFLGALWSHRKVFSETGLTEGAKAVLSDLPLNDPMSERLSNEIMHKLWGKMLHPPASYKGAKYQYRSADGKHNSMLYPELGMAGLPYAKSVQAQRPVNGAKPDVGDLFDLLMAREGKGIESETGISSLLLYQATIVIHDVFRTNDDDKNISDTSSYLDLSPLYGKDADAQFAVRTHEDGLLKPDTFAEHRLLNQPPGVSIFLIMYNRFHNYVTKQLLIINENGKFDLPPDFDDSPQQSKADALKKRDEDLFQTARLITCGLYAQIAIHDYLRCLMTMHTKDTAWTLDPRKEYNSLFNFDRGTVSRGQGNMVSVEFNLLYRFHSPLSKRDTEWSTDLFKIWMEGELDDNGKRITEERIDNGDVPISAMGNRIRAMNKKHKEEVEKRKDPKIPFPDGFDFVGERQEGYRFKRKSDGYFDDEQLVAELVRCIEDPICSFGARQIPKIFKSIEMMGMLQSRKWEVCSLNEFRKFFGMSRHERFEDINENEQICNTLRDLYGDVDSVELYPGYLCEGKENNVDPGVTCPNNQGTAFWTGIFSDAVTLVRSDRFYTTEWNVDAITGWGMREVTSDPTINKGGLLYKLCLRAFPGYFNYNSLHLWQPYYTPAKNLLLAKEQNKLKDLDFDELEYQFEDEKTWTPLLKNAEGELDEGFLRRLAQHTGKEKKEKKEPKEPLRVRRQLASEKFHPWWRGGERAGKIALSNVVIGSYNGVDGKKNDFGDYSIMKGTILGGKDSAKWANPALVAKLDIVAGPLREIMTNEYNVDRWDQAMNIMGGCLGAENGKLETNRFCKYFAKLANDIRLREQRKLQKLEDEQVYQLDVVSDYAIPVITRFFADWLGFWDRVRTVEFPNREFSENAVYELLDNCQDYQSWDSDQTKGMKRRQLFKTSIQKLKALADYGVRKSSVGLFYWRNLFRTYGTGRELLNSPEVHGMRKLAVKSTQALLQKGYSYDEVSSIMLRFALDSAHKLVLNFTEILAYFIDPKTHEGKTIGDHWTDNRTELWREIQKSALKDTAEEDEKILGYALEAQRLTPSLKLARQYIGEDEAVIKTITKDLDGNMKPAKFKIQKGQTILLDIQAANRNSKVFPSPEKFSKFFLGKGHQHEPRRNNDDYLIYGSIVDETDHKQPPHFAKQLSLAYLTAMLKHTASMKQVRVAHDKLGRLRRITTPAGLPGYPQANADALPRYLSPQWDALLPFPTTWDIRFNGMGEGVWEDGDNANQGHGQNQIYQNGELSSGKVEDFTATAAAVPENGDYR